MLSCNVSYSLTGIDVTCPRVFDVPKWSYLEQQRDIECVVLSESVNFDFEIFDFVVLKCVYNFEPCPTGIIGE